MGSIKLEISKPEVPQSGIGILVAVLILLFIVCLIASFYISDTNLKLCYWLIIILLYVVIINIYITITYYMKIRNEPGVKGPRGESGESGITGSDGVCKLSTECGISNCRKIIEKELINIFPEYNRITDKLKRNLVISNSEKKTINQINSYIDMLVPICENGKLSKAELIKYINDSVK
jgi:hypothetical protein